MSSIRVPYDNNNGQLYDGYGGYDVEQNALITETQLNSTEKDIRDYLEKVKEELVEYMDKLKYVSYSYNQNLSTIEQSTAQTNIDFPGRIQGLTKYYFDTYYQEALQKTLNNMDLINTAQQNLISGNARIYYLTEEAQMGQYGIPIYADYFTDLQETDLFYHKINYDNSGYKWDTLFPNDSSSTNDIPNFASNSEQMNHIYHFANYIENGLQNGLQDNYSDHTYINGYIELNPRPSLTYFCPTLLANIKEGDILYCKATKQAYIVTTGFAFPQVCTWYNNQKSLLDIGKDNQDDVFSKLYNPSTAQDVLGAIRDELKNKLGTQTPTYKNIQNSCVYYFYTSSNNYKYRNNYEYGYMVISCTPLSGLILDPTLWEFNGSVLFGTGEEYPNNFAKLFGSSSFSRPIVGDIIYNPLAQEYRRVIRDLTRSERFERETYLTEPIIQYTNGELDNTLRALATYGRGTNLFAIPKEYDISLTQNEIKEGISSSGKFRNNFARLIHETSVNANNESYESETESPTVLTDLGRKIALSTIIFDSTTGDIYPSNQNPWEESRILFNTYFMIPGILQESSMTNFGNVHTLRLGIAHPGDIIQYNEHSYQVTTQPYLRVFTFAEAKKYLMTFGYIENGQYTSGNHSNRTLLGDLLFTLFYYMGQGDIPSAEPGNYHLVDGFKFFPEDKIYYGSNDTDYYSFSEIDQWLAYFNNSAAVQSYALNQYNNNTILDYLDNLYHRLFTNLYRPIVVEAIPLGEESCFGQGDSAYEVYKKNATEPIMSEEQWLNSLKGTNGKNVQVSTINYSYKNQVTFSYYNDQDEYAEKTIDIMNGTNGTNGTNGQDGAGITNITAVRDSTIGRTIITIYYDDNEFTEFILLDGAQGATGTPGRNGTDGTGVTKLKVQSDGTQSLLYMYDKERAEYAPITTFTGIQDLIDNNDNIPMIYYTSNSITRSYLFAQGTTSKITFNSVVGNTSIVATRIESSISGGPDYTLTLPIHSSTDRT